LRAYIKHERHTLRHKVLKFYKMLPHIVSSGDMLSSCQSWIGDVVKYSGSSRGSPRGNIVQEGYKAACGEEV
jgi:hypothetical protein